MAGHWGAWSKAARYGELVSCRRNRESLPREAVRTFIIIIVATEGRCVLKLAGTVRLAWGLSMHRGECIKVRC